MKPPPLHPAPRAILFDLDDTLCDYATARELRLRVAFSLDEQGRQVDRTVSQLNEMIAESIRMHPHGVDHFPDLFRRFELDPDAAEVAASWYRGNRFHGLRLFPGVERVLERVRHSAAPGPGTRPIGIITNGPTEVQRAKVNLLGLDRLVDFVLISEEFGVAKPDAEIFGEALRLAGVGPHEATFVGDSADFDMAGAIALDIPAIWVNRQGVRWERTEREPDRVVPSVVEVPGLVGSG